MVECNLSNVQIQGTLLGYVHFVQAYTSTPQHLIGKYIQYIFHTLPVRVSPNVLVLIVFDKLKCSFIYVTKLKTGLLI